MEEDKIVKNRTAYEYLNKQSCLRVFFISKTALIYILECFFITDFCLKTEVKVIDYIKTT